MRAKLMQLGSRRETLPPAYTGDAGPNHRNRDDFAAIAQFGSLRGES